jgi:hypothetical protein
VAHTYREAEAMQIRMSLATVHTALIMQGHRLLGDLVKLPNEGCIARSERSSGDVQLYLWRLTCKVQAMKKPRHCHPIVMSRVMTRQYWSMTKATMLEHSDVGSEGNGLVGSQDFLWWSESRTEAVRSWADSILSTRYTRYTRTPV